MGGGENKFCEGFARCGKGKGGRAGGRGEKEGKESPLISYLSPRMIGEKKGMFTSISFTRLRHREVEEEKNVRKERKRNKKTRVSFSPHHIYLKKKKEGERAGGGKETDFRFVVGDIEGANGRGRERGTKEWGGRGKVLLDIYFPAIRVGRRYIREKIRRGRELGGEKATLFSAGKKRKKKKNFSR